jgi:hypothetical protein
VAASDIGSVYPDSEPDHREYLCLDIAYQYSLLAKGFNFDPDNQKVELVAKLPYHGEVWETCFVLGARVKRPTHRIARSARHLFTRLLQRAQRSRLCVRLPATGAVAHRARVCASLTSPRAGGWTRAGRGGGVVSGRRAGGDGRSAQDANRRAQVDQRVQDGQDVHSTDCLRWTYEQPPSCSFLLALTALTPPPPAPLHAATRAAASGAACKVEGLRDESESHWRNTCWMERRVGLVCHAR